MSASQVRRNALIPSSGLPGSGNSREPSPAVWASIGATASWSTGGTCGSAGVALTGQHGTLLSTGPTALPRAEMFDPYGVAKGYLNRFLHHHRIPQPTIASTAVLGSGTVATRKPKELYSNVGFL